MHNNLEVFHFAIALSCRLDLPSLERKYPFCISDSIYTIDGWFVSAYRVTLGFTISALGNRFIPSADILIIKHLFCSWNRCGAHCGSINIWMLHIYHLVYLGLTSDLTENSATWACAPTASVMNTDEKVKEYVQRIQCMDGFEGMALTCNHLADFLSGWQVYRLDVGNNMYIAFWQYYYFKPLNRCTVHYLDHKPCMFRLHMRRHRHSQRLWWWTKCKVTILFN